MKIYTKTGDDGSTGLLLGIRVSKDDVRIEAYGTVDELSAIIGLSRTEQIPENVDQFLQQIQNDLFDIGAELASQDPERSKTKRLAPGHIERLEQIIDELDSQLPPLQVFVLPGGSREASWVHLARTVCRRAERRVVTLSHSQPIDPLIVHYLNRLSDLFFVTARFLNQCKDMDEIPWNSRPTKS